MTPLEKRKKKIVYKGWMNPISEGYFIGHEKLKFKSVRTPPDTDVSFFGIRFPILWKKKVDGFTKVSIIIKPLTSSKERE
jgi:hypothetical protein